MNFKFLYLLSVCVAFEAVHAGYWAEDLADYPKKWPLVGSCKGTCAIIANPTGDKKGQLVLAAKYPAGSCSSSCGIASGVGFDVAPTGNFTGNEATLEYEVFFPSDFEFVRGGKLPGISGGPRGCSGCTKAEPLRSQCFSARFMWGANGQGFAYLYVPLKTKHTSEFCALVSGNRMGWGIIASKQLRSSEAIPC